MTTPETRIKHSMTDDIAFELGQFNFKRFYSHVIWNINREPFPLYYFFNWKVGHPLGGVPIKSETHEVDWDNIDASGTLKKECFIEKSHKLSYIRGVISNHNGRTITETSITLCWGNSYDLVDIFVEFCRDILFGKSGFSITKFERVGTYPGTPKVTIEAKPEIIKYLTGDTNA